VKKEKACGVQITTQEIHIINRITNDDVEKAQYKVFSDLNGR